MTDYETHEPELSRMTTDDWDDPQLEEFDTDDLEVVGDRFLLSASGFLSENFTDLKLPVVEPNSELNRNVLQTAKSSGHGVGAIDDIDRDLPKEAEDLIDELANEHFEGADFSD